MCFLFFGPRENMWSSYWNENRTSVSASVHMSFQLVFEMIIDTFARARETDSFDTAPDAPTHRSNKEKKQDEEQRSK